jgi:membrane fusion protein, multidrug efflux system
MMADVPHSTLSGTLMKKLRTFLGIMILAGAGTWLLRNDLPLTLQQPLQQAGRLTGLMPATAPSGDGSPGGRSTARTGESAPPEQGQGRRNAGPSVVRTVAASMGALPLDVAATGFAEAARTTTIAALQQGLVVSVAASDGQHVRAGDLIAKLDDRTALADVAKDKANIASDEAGLTEAEAALARAENLLKQSAQSQQGYEQAKAARDSATAKIDADRATLAADEVALEHMEIRAPYDGRLGDIAMSEGAYVSAGASIVTITQYDPISVAFRLPQRYLPHLHPGIASRAPVDVDPAATGGVQDRGTLTFFDNAVDEASGTVLVKAEFQNDKGTLWPGENVNVTVHFAAAEPSVIVPTVAVRPGADGPIVYTVGEGAKVRAIRVAIQRSNGDQTAIAHGLAQGDHVVVEGQLQLVDGQTVVEQFAGQQNEAPLPVADAGTAAGATTP